MAGEKKVDKKQKIIEAAVKVFTEKGAPFTKLNEVAKVAKVPAPLIHYYYQSIEDLHFDVIQFALEDLKEYSVRLINPKLGALQMMREYVKGPFLWLDEKEDLAAIWFYFYYLASWSERFKEVNTQIRNGGRDRISTLIYQGLEQEVFSLDGRTVRDVAHEVQSIITGWGLMYATEKKTAKKNYHYEQALELILKQLGV